TAIVGASGSGKSTLLKLLLQFYQPRKGSIQIGSKKLDEIPMDRWREKCGGVLQAGKLFEDSIERNVTESKSKFPTDKKQYNRAIQASMLTDFIDSLPHKSKTLVGDNGMLLSGGE